MKCCRTIEEWLDASVRVVPGCTSRYISPDHKYVMDALRHWGMVLTMLPSTTLSAFSGAQRGQGRVALVTMACFVPRLYAVTRAVHDGMTGEELDGFVKLLVELDERSEGWYIVVSREEFDRFLAVVR